MNSGSKDPLEDKKLAAKEGMRVNREGPPHPPRHQVPLHDQNVAEPLPGQHLCPQRRRTADYGPTEGGSGPTDGSYGPTDGGYGPPSLNPYLAPFLLNFGHLA